MLQVKIDVIHKAMSRFFFKCLVLQFFFLFVSCNEYDRSKYPQSLSKNEIPLTIPNCYSQDILKLESIPVFIREKINIHLKNRLENELIERIHFDQGMMFYNQSIISKSEAEILEMFGNESELKSCNSTLSFPIYSLVYYLKIPEKGLDQIGLHLLVDANGAIVENIDFPKGIVIDNIISIDSVHNELIRRKIPYKNLKIDFSYDPKEETFFWITSTLLDKGSFYGPSCFPLSNYHFKMNALNGEVTIYNL